MSNPPAKIPINSLKFTDSTVDPETRSAVNELLLHNNHIPKIHATLLHEAQASGFVEHVRTRAIDLLRTGKATTFTECMEQVMSQVRLEGIDADATASTNGASKDANKLIDHGEKLVVPKAVVDAGNEALRKHLDPYLVSDDQDQGSKAA